jgi:pimeloyl-ACP methyl ester carboxylesterase
MTLARTEGVHTATDGRRIGWIRLGDPSLPVVAYWHGQPGSRRDVLAFAETAERFGLGLLAVDRGGYGETDPVGPDRRDAARDLLVVADEQRIERFAVMGVSMGGVYSLTTAALAPDRVSKVVLMSGHVLPYDDDDVVAGLSEAEQADVARLRGGRTPQLEREYTEAAASIAADPRSLLAQLASGWSVAEQGLVGTPFIEHVAASLQFGLAPGGEGMLADGLRTVRPLEIDPADVRCPVRAVHGTRDDLEPYANLQRLAALLPDVHVLTLDGLGHFAPWLWPDLWAALVVGD